MIKYIRTKEYLVKDKVFDLDILNGKSAGDHEWSMDYKEGTALYNIAMELKPLVILETGTFHGFSASYLLAALEEIDRGILFTIEPDTDRVKIAKERLTKVGRRFSVIYSPLTVVDWSQPINMLFIDGEHGKVKDDLDKYVKFVPPGGVILCHDYHGIHCKNGIDDFFYGRESAFDITILPDTEFKNDLYIAVVK